MKPLQAHTRARPLALLALGALLFCSSLVAAAAAAEQSPIRPGVAFPALPEDSFSELQGFPPSPRELTGRVVVLLLFQAGKHGELDDTLALLEELSGYESEQSLLVLGVATCVDVQNDATSLDDSYIRNMIALTRFKRTRVVRDRDERLWPRVLVRTASGYRRGTPSIVVVGADARTLYTGFLGDSKRIDSARRVVRAACALAMAPDAGLTHPLAQPAADAYAADRMDTALGAVTKLLADEKTPPQAAAVAAELLFLIQLRFEANMGHAEALLDEGRVDGALDALTEIRRLFGSSECGDEALERRRAVESDEGLIVERKADRAVRIVIDDLASRGELSERARQSYARRLKAAAARFPGTRSAARALARAAELE